MHCDLLFSDRCALERAAAIARQTPASSHIALYIISFSGLVNYFSRASVPFPRHDCRSSRFTSNFVASFVIAVLRTAHVLERQQPRSRTLGIPAHTPICSSLAFEN